MTDDSFQQDVLHEPGDALTGGPVAPGKAQVARTARVRTRAGAAHVLPLVAS